MAVLDPIKVVIENYDADTVETLTVANQSEQARNGYS
ncbi:hypothetical protein O9993_13355 [Vibrio lentus]|nr:hypothetical protein [Vibrio lentus]